MSDAPNAPDDTATDPQAAIDAASAARAEGRDPRVHEHTAGAVVLERGVTAQVGVGLDGEDDPHLPQRVSAVGERPFDGDAVVDLAGDRAHLADGEVVVEHRPREMEPRCTRDASDVFRGRRCDRPAGDVATNRLGEVVDAGPLADERDRHVVAGASCGLFVRPDTPDGCGTGRRTAQHHDGVLGPGGVAGQLETLGVVGVELHRLLFGPAGHLGVAPDDR